MNDSTVNPDIQSESPAFLSMSTRKALLLLAWPLVSSQVLRNLFNLIDVAFIGRLGPTAVAGVTTSGVIMMPLFAFVIGIMTATRAMVARYYGAKRFDELNQAISAALLYGLIFSLIFMAASYLIYPNLFVTIMGVEMATAEKIVEYMEIITFAAFTRIFFFIIATSLQAVGDSKTPLKVMALTVGINIILDPIFIFGLGPAPALGVKGAALATVFAWGIGTIICFIILMRGSSLIRYRLKDFQLNRTSLLTMVKVGSPPTLRIGLGHIGSIIMMRIVAGYGTVVLAAVGICIRIRLLTFLPGMGLGNAAGILIGQNLGIKRQEEAENVAYKALKYYELLAFPMFLSLVFFSEYIMRAFTPDEGVIAAGVGYLRYYGIGLPVFVIYIILSKAMEGAGDTVPPFIISLLGIFAIQITGAFILPDLFNIGVTGVWIAVMLSLFFLGLVTTIWFKRGSWKDKVL